MAASKLTGVDDSAGSSIWLTDACCEIRAYPAQAIIVHELDADYTYAMGERSSKARSSVRGSACPPQWLPVLLATASPSPSPPSPPSSPLLPPATFTRTADLRAAAQEFDADATSAIAKYGPIANWGVSSITSMNGLFRDLINFNADTSSWDTSGVTDMGYMFAVHSLPCLNIQLGPCLHATCGYTLLRLGRAHRRSTSH